MLKPIGEGVHSQVWLAYDRTTKIAKAIKIQRPDHIDEGDKEMEIMKTIRDKYRSEYLNCLDNSFIETIPTEDEDEDDEAVCIVTDLRLGSLYDLMTNNYPDGLPPKTVLKIIYQTLVAMKTLNEMGYMHTDIKPENMLVGAPSDEAVKIVSDVEKMNPKAMKSKRDRIKLLQRFDWYEETGESDSDDSDEDTDDLSEGGSSEASELSQLTDEDYSLNFSQIHEADDEEESDDEKKPYVIDDEWLEKPDVRLSDFGLCVAIEKINDEEIQTRHYRAPEVITRCKYDTTADVWSLGCMMFELLTGKVLFRPESPHGLAKDRHHLVMMINLLGPLPSECIAGGRRSRMMLTPHGEVRGATPSDYSSATLKSRLGSTVTLGEFQNPIIELLEGMIAYHPQRRNIDDLLAHPVFQEADVQSLAGRAARTNDHPKRVPRRRPGTR